MWTTKLEQRPGGGHNVRLSRDGVLIATISLNEWWVMSATDFLANAALQNEGLNFRARDTTANGPIGPLSWTTSLVPLGDACDVHLLRDGKLVAVFGLQEWADLPATEFIVQDIVEQTYGLSQYGSNIEEYLAAIEETDDDS